MPAAGREKTTMQRLGQALKDADQPAVDVAASAVHPRAGVAAQEVIGRFLAAAFASTADVDAQEYVAYEV
jgi:hypothetical protein